jgi:hypothetical protein
VLIEEPEKVLTTLLFSADTERKKSKNIYVSLLLVLVPIFC